MSTAPCRFDSFAPESEREPGSTLLTRFGELIYMFFVITPPEATVDNLLGSLSHYLSRKGAAAKGGAAVAETSE